MMRNDVFFAAMQARDPRFDGKFFVGVKTTGIYCRPICPAKPKRENVEFFRSHIEAEKAGYRPCLRCRPESAPRSPAWIGKSAIVQRAVRVLSTQDATDLNEDAFAEMFGVTARHLRRLFRDEIGKTPKQLSTENRLNLARKLIVETAMPITEVAFSSGFASIRRFNHAFRDRFKKAPREVRRNRVSEGGGLRVRLPYRPPFDFAGLIKSYEAHRIGNLEWFRDEKMYRVIAMGGKVGKICISNDETNSRINLEIDFPDTSSVHTIISKVRNLFDLDSDPVVIANALEADPSIKEVLERHPGIRLPSGWDPFEVAVSTILGQLVSVERGRMLVHDLIEIAGDDSGLEFDNRKIRFFPSAAQIVAADLSALKTTGARKRTLVAFAQAILSRTISLESTQDVDCFIKDVSAIGGIGPWTASYMALKALRSTDMLPASDLLLARALERHSMTAIETMRPWRSYVAALLWRSYVPDNRPNREP